jgi:hypothetical protein
MGFAAADLNRAAAPIVSAAPRRSGTCPTGEEESWSLSVSWMSVFRSRSSSVRTRARSCSSTPSTCAGGRRRLPGGMDSRRRFHAAAAGLHLHPASSWHRRQHDVHQRRRVGVRGGDARSGEPAEVPGQPPPSTPRARLPRRTSSPGPAHASNVLHAPPTASPQDRLGILPKDQLERGLLSTTPRRRLRPTAETAAVRPSRQDASAIRSFRAGRSTGVGSSGLLMAMARSMSCAGRWNMKAR